MTYCRRKWLKLIGGSLILHGAHHSRLSAAETSSWKMGLIADLHFGLAPDALKRLDRFMESVDQKSPDCILQLGDFNFGVGSEDCMATWDQFSGPKYHVLGNHDMDKSNKEKIVDLWGMPNPYYSFDHRGWHFVVLDRNHLRAEDGQYIPYANANFYVDAQRRGYADAEQLDWLQEDLDKTQLPTVVFSHQGLGMEPEAIPRSANGAIEEVLESANQGGMSNVVACFCGHHHRDRYHQRRGIHYVWINSASYFWVGSKFGRMAMYTEPLFTFLTFQSDGSIKVEGCQSDWSSPTPRERGYPGWEQLNTQISDRCLG